MFIRFTIIILAASLLPACTQRGKYYDAGQKETTARKVSYTADSSVSLTKAKQTDFYVPGMQLFCNNEIAPYCVLLPLDDFKEDYTNNKTVKAQHRFVLKQDTANFTSIEVQGFIIDKKNNYNTQLFYKRDKSDIEEGGLGIDTAYIDEANHFYMVKGYLPNYMNMKFVQLNWILEDRIAVYFNYDEKEEALWTDRINAIIKRGVGFDKQ